MARWYSSSKEGGEGKSSRAHARQPTKKGLKGVVIDGSNFIISAQEKHGVNRIHAKVLYSILKHYVGDTREFYGKPIIVMNENMRGVISDLYEKVGFEVHCRNSRSKEDDELIIQLIDAVNPRHVDELIVVSGDADFWRPLHDAKERGISVVVAGINACIAQVLKDSFKTFSLDPYMDKLDLKNKRACTSSIPMREEDVVFVLRLEGIPQEERARYANQILPQILKAHGLKGTVT